MTALVVLLVFLSALFGLPPLGWAAFTGFFIMIGAAEWAKLSRYSEKGKLAYLICTFVFCMILLFIWGHTLGFSTVEVSRNEWTGGVIKELNLWIYLVASLFWFVAVPIWLIRGWHARGIVIKAVVGWLVLIPTWVAIVSLHYEVGPVGVLIVMGVVWAADIAAYFAGKRFGKNKLAPNISPGKTWEGVIGALVAAGCYGLFLINVNYVDVKDDLYRGGLFIIILWILVAVSIVGDLFESLIKRQAHVKDSGTLLPGHGGLLDRIDSMTSTLPVAAFVMMMAHIVKAKY